MPHLPQARLLPWFDLCTNTVLQTSANLQNDVNLDAPLPARNMMERLTTLRPANQGPDTVYKLNATGFGPLQTDPRAYVAAIGWDHAVLLRRDKYNGVTYKVAWIFAHERTSKPVFGLDPRNPLQPQETMTLKAPHGCKLGQRIHGEECNWFVYRGPDVPVRHVVTFGVSACSLTVAFPDDAEFIMLAHMDSKAPVPIGLLANRLTASERFGLIRAYASAISERPELLKFEKAKAYRLLENVRPVVLPRCFVPTDEDGDENVSGFGHDEIGLELPTAFGVPPKLTGIVGADRVGGALYGRLLPSLVFDTLKGLGNQRRPPSMYEEKVATQVLLWLKTGRYGYSGLHNAIIERIRAQARTEASAFFAPYPVKHLERYPSWTIAHIIGTLLVTPSRNHPYFACFDTPTAHYRARFSIPLTAQPHQALFQAGQVW
jgi:hypothetical protein